MENNLPENWELINLVEDLNYQPTGVLKYEGLKRYFSTGSIQDSNNIPEGEFNFENRPSRANREVILNDVLQARMKNTDKGILIDKNLDGQLFSTGFIQLRSYADTYNSRLLYYLIKSDYFLNQKNDYATGSTQEALTDDGAKKITIPLPPLPEQHRIVAKLDALFEKIESNKQRLEKIPKILKRFRQSVLAAAVSGKLTEDWRKENKNVEGAKIKLTKKKNRTILDDKSQDYDLYELPTKWNWHTISDVADVKGGKRIPKGEKLVQYDTGLPYIKAGDIKNGIVLQNKLEYLLPTTQVRIKNYIVATGDILITNVGACIGDVGIVPEELNNANQTENALKLCNHEGVYNYYLAFWLQSPIAQDLIRQTVLSAAQGKLALGRIEVFPIPLPPVEEQNEIVRKVEQLLAFADKIEARYTIAKAMLDKLPQSILAKAFLGELVVQDPNDEPASVLLERIKAVKEKLAAEKKGKKTKKYSIEETTVKIAAEKGVKYKKEKK